MAKDSRDEYRFFGWMNKGPLEEMGQRDTQTDTKKSLPEAVRVIMNETWEPRATVGKEPNTKSTNPGKVMQSKEKSCF